MHSFFLTTHATQAHHFFGPGPFFLAATFSRWMKAVLTLLCLLPVAAIAEPHKIPFSLAESLPFTVSLVLPESVSVAAHEKKESGDSIRARIGDSSPGMFVEVSGPKGDILWSHDFGSNLSAPEGNTITVSYQHKSRILLVHYQGYKWDHDHKLLFIEPDHQPLSIREYSTAEKDILPLLKRQKDFAADYHYWIYPLRFTDRGVEFECVPRQKPERQTAHPFAQDQKWYLVTATVNQKRRIIPTDVKATH